ncbi:MAG TPA: thiamine pyrophosphate-dependent dehydrogenase E1 component subunit alpha [Polyangia bacterium]|jgi:pyruvate dehydrogenase E1 component alpha subunit/2-oxoisovalerate dehydrogenase E1 component alpha subunit|nr:thiamine pyrophosphate-dependent dehydrogenase E1 component subunit alpha [Polyangia bacterium]
MAASKPTPPPPPGKLVTPPPLPASVPAAKIRAGMGDVEAETVEVWSDRDHRRATELWTILSPDGVAERAQVPALQPEQLIAIYRSMLRIRIIDERLLNLQRQGRVGFYAEARGQEASIIGAVAAIGPDDFVVPAHREYGAALHRGLPLRALLAQLFGNANDISHGRQMPGHVATPRSLNFLTPSSCVATQLPHATGIAWAAKKRGKPIVVLAYLGEGATSAEDFHAGLNFAAVYRTPVVFLCENNQWAISTPASQQTASVTFAVKALAYGMPGVRVDGNDALVVYAATKEAVDRARGGGGPTLIEAVTFRMGPHSTSDDPARYRQESALGEWTRKDPLSRLRTWLATENILDGQAEAALRETIDRELQEAIAAEESVGPPARESLFTDVYAQPTAALQEQQAELLRLRTIDED